MILRIRHKGLKRLYEDADRSGLNAQHVEKIERILANLDDATNPGDMDRPGLKLHLLKGDLASFWSVKVSANMRIIFRFEGANVTDVDLIDYH